jgi:hypothetical protein
MLAAAVNSSRSWDQTVPFDRVEDLLHSFAATTMGFAFALGVFAVLAVPGYGYGSMFLFSADDRERVRASSGWLRR